MGRDRPAVRLLRVLGDGFTWPLGEERRDGPNRIVRHHLPPGVCQLDIRAASMPSWLQGFAANQPVSVVASTVRALMLCQWLADPRIGDVDSGDTRGLLPSRCASLPKSRQYLTQNPNRGICAPRAKSLASLNDPRANLLHSSERTLHCVSRHRRGRSQARLGTRSDVSSGVGLGLPSIGPLLRAARVDGAEATERIRDSLASLGLEIRAGIHTGEIDRRGDDVSGMGVIVASRIQSLATDGEIWVSPTVPGLVVGSPIVFEERETQVLKGVPGQWTLSAVV